MHTIRLSQYILFSLILVISFVIPINIYAQHIAYLDSVLETDLERELKSLYNDKSWYAQTQGYKPNNITIDYYEVNFSDDNGEELDYFIVADMDAKWYKARAMAMMVYLHKAGKYELKFRWFNKNYNTINPELIDIDSDGKQEILLESDRAHPSTPKTYVTIWKYKSEGFEIIFEEGLYEVYFFTYYYKNQYSFVKNELNSSTFNIRFQIKTVIDEEKIEDHENPRRYSLTIKGKEYHIELPEPFHDTIIYRFNGDKYIPNKEVYDYRKPSREFLEIMDKFK